MKENSIKYHLFALFTVFVWGTTLVSTKVLINNGLSPQHIFLFRFVLAYICIWFISPKKIWAGNKNDELKFLLLGFFGGSFYFVTENMALEITQASNVALILSSVPILTSVLTLLLFKNEKATKGLIYGSILAFGGVALVVFNGNFVLQLNPLGDFLTMLSALSWSFYSILMKIMGNKYDTIFITRKVFFYGIITFIPLLYFYPINYDINFFLQPSIGSNLLFLGIVASMICFIMWNLTVKNLGLFRSANYLYLVPLITMVTSATILNEKITFIAILGSLLILVGVFIAEKGTKKNK